MRKRRKWGQTKRPGDDVDVVAWKFGEDSGRSVAAYRMVYRANLERGTPDTFQVLRVNLPSEGWVLLVGGKGIEAQELAEQLGIDAEAWEPTPDVVHHLKLQRFRRATRG